jgi:hypothetical protein
VVALVAVLGSAAFVPAQEVPITVPQAAVPEVFTLQGEFVRLAYNNEGFVTLGYRAANKEVGKEWMLLDVGITLLNGAKDYTLKREALSVTTPDGSRVPLATQSEFIQAGYLKALNRRAEVAKDSVNYFPPLANQPCALRFFAPAGKIVYDQVELSEQRACFGRVYFHVPGGIQYGQHWLNVQFASGEVQVPFRVLTEEEEKVLRKQWKELKKQHEANLKGE